MNLIERLRAMGNGQAEPMIGDYDEAADELEAQTALIAELVEALTKIEEMMGTAFGAGVYDMGPPPPGLHGTRSHSRNGYAQAVYEISRNARSKAKLATTAEKSV